MALDHVISLENALISVDDHIILEQVQLTVERGEFVYVIGRVGSGKTSLYCAVIVKQVDAKTRAKTSINDLLRGD